MHTQFYLNQLEEVIARKAQEFEAPWLSSFAPKVYGDAHKLFLCEPEGDINLENCNYLHPNALTMYHGASIPQIEGYAFDEFARGAATIGSILNRGEADRAADFIKMQLDVMNQRALSEENPYPAIFEAYLPVYCGCLTFLLLEGEVTNWHILLGFILGFIWMLSYVSIDDRDAEAIINVLFNQIKRGTYF